jgi:hypothetical protein
MTLTRPTAQELDGKESPPSTLRIELARDCDEEPRGDVAAYEAQFPYYGLKEVAKDGAVASEKHAAKGTANGATSHEQPLAPSSAEHWTERDDHL